MSRHGFSCVLVSFYLGGAGEYREFIIEGGKEGEGGGEVCICTVPITASTEIHLEKWLQL